MYVKSVTLANFRNYESQNIMFKKGLNIIFGKNASGKTNLLESVYFAGIGKSARASKDKDMVRWGADMAYVRAEVCKKFRNYIIEMRIDSKNKKYISLDGIPIKKVGDLLGVLNIVYFSPDELKLIKESPVERRRFMDISISQQKRLYYHALVKYNKILAQRNKLLKTMRDVASLKDCLPIWDGQLAHEGAIIIKCRYEFLTQLSKIANVTHKELTAGKEVLEISYESLVENLSRERIEEKLVELYAKSCEKDFNLGYTSVGAHRDDIDIVSNGKDVKKFGSQGQQRTVALSLKLAEIEMFEAETGEKPILLLDDVLSELDQPRQLQLLKATKGTQTILTCTEADERLGEAKVLQYISVAEGCAVAVAK